jgi:hypothetical protein
MSLKRLRLGGVVVREEAKRALRLSNDEAQILFAGEPLCGCGSDSCRYGWPSRFAEKYERAKTARGRARAAADQPDLAARHRRALEGLAWERGGHQPVTLPVLMMKSM